ncbi:hypothetical protein [Halomonas aquatica]|uniref:Uncharacterized protein n=1 Tax=Halomonas aquatica TaxID=3151123 RepID=A0ABV1NG44_9GAMM
MRHMNNMFLALLFTLCMTPAYSDSAYNMAVASGKLIAATNLAESLKESECGYAIKKTYSTSDVIEEIKLVLRESDAESLDRYVSSNDFQEEMIESEEGLINKPLAIMKRDGVDKKTACGMLVANMAILLDSSRVEWERSKNKY